MPNTPQPTPTRTPLVALETTLPAFGVPRDAAPGLIADLDTLVREAGAEPATVGVLDGKPIVSMTRDEVISLIDRANLVKGNTSNLGVVIHQGRSAATTVSATIELAAGAGIQVMATGGIGGVHPDHIDVSTDLVALSRFPVAVACSGCKTILDVRATREALETLGVPVIGFGADDFPAFYLRSSGMPVDARFDEARDLARFVGAELTRTGRGVLVVNPIPEPDAIDEADWRRWLAEAQERVAQSDVVGRSVTPALLAALHEVSNGATLRANLALVRSNVQLGARLAVAMAMLSSGA